MKQPSTALSKIDARQYPYIKALWMSLYSANLYVDVKKRWRGVGVLYLLFSLALIMLPMCVQGIISLNSYIQNEVIKPLERIPSLQIVNGVVQTKPMAFKNKRGETVVLIDTSQKKGRINQNQTPNLRVLITQTTLSFAMPKYQAFYNSDVLIGNQDEYQHTFSATDNATFDGKALAKATGLTRLKYYVLLSVWPMFVSAIFGLSLVLLLVLAMMGQLVAQVIYKYTLSYKEACRILAVSFTPLYIVFVLCMMIQTLQDYVAGLSIIVLAVYFSFGVLANRRYSKKLARTSLNEKYSR